MTSKIIMDEDILSEYETWLKSKSYAYTTVRCRVRIAQRILQMNPEIPPEPVAMEEITSTRLTAGSKGAVKTRVRSFYEYLQSQGAL